MRAAALVLTTALAGCAHLRMACPHDGGPRWVELTSPHFSLRTDLPDAKAREALRDAERILSTLTSIAEFLLPETPDVSRTTLVIFAENWEYQKVTEGQQADWRGMSIGETLTDERERPTIVISADMKTSEVFRHELTHRLVNQRLGPVPIWLNEGLAEYFSSVNEVNGKLALGPLTSRWHRWRRRAREPREEPIVLPPLTDFLSPKGVAVGLEGGYLLSWMLVHYLANGGPDHAERFRRFLSAVADGHGTEALTAEYGPLDTIDAAMRKHTQTFETGQALQWVIDHRPIEHSEEPPVVRVLDDAEVHALKAALRPPVADQELRLATAHASDSAALHAWLARRAEAKHDDATVAREAARAVELAPDTPSYLYEHARARFDEEMRRPEAARKLDALAPEMTRLSGMVDEPLQLAVLARYFALAGDAARALSLAERAIKLEPRAASVLVSLAAAYFAAGDAARAASTQKLALRRWPGPSVPAEQKQLLERYRAGK